MALYKIQISPITNTKMCAAKPYITKIETDDIEWSMEQYQRNREPFEWKMIDWNIRV